MWASWAASISIRLARGSRACRGKSSDCWSGCWYCPESVGRVGYSSVLLGVSGRVLARVLRLVGSSVVAGGCPAEAVGGGVVVTQPVGLAVEGEHHAAVQ